MAVAVLSSWTVAFSTSTDRYLLNVAYIAYAFAEIPVGLVFSSSDERMRDFSRFGGEGIGVNYCRPEAVFYFWTGIFIVMCERMAFEYFGFRKCNPTPAQDDVHGPSH
jgi:hypothetical protein